MDIEDANFVNPILERLASAYGVDTESALSLALGKPRTTVNSWKIRKSVPYEECVIAADKFGLSLDWLIFGEGDKYRIEKSGAAIDERLMRTVLCATLEWVTERDLLHDMPPQDLATLCMIMYKAQQANEQDELAISSAVRASLGMMAGGKKTES